MNLKKYGYYAGSIPRLLAGMQPWPRVLAIFLRTAGPGPYTVTLRRSGLRFTARSAMDLWSIKETLLDRFYERYGASVQPGWTVVDIGGGLGDYAIFAAAEQPTCRVHTIEPTPESFALLEHNLAANQLTNVQAHSFAVWSKHGQVTLDTSLGEAVQFISREAGAAEPVGTGQPASKAGPGGAAHTPTVTSLTLAEALEACGVAYCDLMKMDCEGAEYPILFNTDPGTLQKIERIVMEYHDNAGPYTHRDLQKFLSEQGYAVKVYPSPVHSYLGYLYAARPATGKQL
jgi:FkbM family methyltransferase